MANASKKLKSEKLFVDLLNNPSTGLLNSFLKNRSAAEKLASLGVKSFQLSDFVAQKGKRSYECSDAWAERSGKKTKSGNKKEQCKTDVILEHSPTGTKLKISLKTGDGRLTSCNLFETKALLKLVCESNPDFASNEKLKFIIDDLLETWDNGLIRSDSKKGNIYTDYDLTLGSRRRSWTEEEIQGIPDAKLREYKRLCQNVLSPKIREISHTYSDYFLKVFRETATGRLKFGEKSPLAIADLFVEWDDGEKSAVPSITKVLDPETEEFDVTVSREIMKKDKGVNINIKNSSPECKSHRSHWIRFM